MRINDIHVDEEICITLVKWHENDFFVLGDEFIDHLYGLSVNKKTTQTISHQLVEVP